MTARVKPKTPDLTPAQLVSAAVFLVAQAVAWGWIGNDDGQKIVSLAGTVIPAVWMVVDALIRSARNKRVAAEHAALGRGTGSR